MHLESDPSTDGGSPGCCGRWLARSCRERRGGGEKTGTVEQTESPTKGPNGVKEDILDKPTDERSDRKESKFTIAAAAIASGRNYKEAAAAARWSERSVRRAMADPKFRSRVQKLRSEGASQLSGMLLDAGPDAYMVLIELLYAERPIDRWRAAQTLLVQGRSSRREDDFDERLSALERIANDGLAADSAVGEEE